ncbi:MAG: SPOR domain-containing protein [Mariprofundaceae bacterium]
MAGRDFAQVEAPTLTEEGSGQLRSALLVFGILSIVAISFMGGFWLGKEHGAQMVETAEKARLVTQVQEQQKELEALRKQAKQQQRDQGVSTTRVGELTFYNELPRQPVMPESLSTSAESKKSSSPKKVASDATGHENNTASALEKIIEQELARTVSSSKAPDGNALAAFRLQVGSFQKRSDTRMLEEQLAGLGLPVYVQAVHLSELGRWYRVYAGPFASRSTAEKKQRLIKDKLKISALLVHGGK